MLRISVTLAFLLVASIIIFIGFHVGATTGPGSLLLNLGTTVIGIALTVAIVEWLFEKKQTKNEARRMAWRTLHRLDHAVWVWQGGSREFDANELLGLLASVTDSDPIPPFTETLFLVLGSDAENRLRHQGDIVQANTELEKALGCLKKLSAVRDSEDSLSPTQIAENLSKTARLLAKAVRISFTEDIEIKSTESSMRFEKCSLEQQEWRHFGRINESFEKKAIKRP